MLKNSCSELHRQKGFNSIIVHIISWFAGASFVSAVNGDPQFGARAVPQQANVLPSSAPTERHFVELPEPETGNTNPEGCHAAVQCAAPFCLTNPYTPCAAQHSGFGGSRVESHGNPQFERDFIEPPAIRSLREIVLTRNPPPET